MSEATGLSEVSEIRLFENFFCQDERDIKLLIDLLNKNADKHHSWSVRRIGGKHSAVDYLVLKIHLDETKVASTEFFYLTDLRRNKVVKKEYRETLIAFTQSVMRPLLSMESNLRDKIVRIKTQMELGKGNLDLTIPGAMAEWSEFLSKTDDFRDKYSIRLQVSPDTPIPDYDPYFVPNDVSHLRSIIVGLEKANCEKSGKRCRTFSNYLQRKSRKTTKPWVSSQVIDETTKSTQSVQETADRVETPSRLVQRALDMVETSLKEGNTCDQIRVRVPSVRSKEWGNCDVFWDKQLQRLETGREEILVQLDHIRDTKQKIICEINEEDTAYVEFAASLSKCVADFFDCCARRQ